MTPPSKPVWIWLPGHSSPMRCGVFSLRQGVGEFSYDEAYRQHPEALALDPINLPLTRSRRAFKEVRQGGLFGVLRDASPEGFGLALLEQLRQISLNDPLDRLEASVGDGVGALEVCEDIGSKQSWQAPSVQALRAALAQLPPERPSSQATREVLGLHGTSLGGERPKLTVLHEGQHWIAKLQDRGDSPHAPLREFVAMRLALEVGIDAAPVQFERQGERELLLVRRFDRQRTPQGHTLRQLYASAHTVLRLDAQTRGEKARSYVALARELQRWCGSQHKDPQPMQRELWRRMVWNAICGNGDDHPRNHGLVQHQGQWQLAPAFDVAPYIRFSGTLALAVNRSGSSQASAHQLLADCTSFGWTRPEALDFLRHAQALYQQRWPQLVASLGIEPEAALLPDTRYSLNTSTV